MVSIKALMFCIGKGIYNTARHDGIEHAGYLAFLGLLALFPFLVFIVALAGFLGEGQAGTEFIRLVFHELPPDMVRALQPRVAEIISGPPQGLLTVAILGAIWTSSSAVEGYRTVLNRAYHVSAPPPYLLRRLLSIVQILIFSFAVVVAMVVLVVLPILWGKIGGLLGNGAAVNLATGKQIAVMSVMVIFFVVSVTYYTLPNIRQNLHSVLPGAAAVTLLWIGVARLLSLYLSQFNQVNIIYGSLGGVIAALLFFYVSNIIFIFGAEFNYQLKKALGEKIEQKQFRSKEN